MEVDAVLAEEAVWLMPSSLNLAYLLRAILPVEAPSILFDRSVADSDRAKAPTVQNAKQLSVHIRCSLVAT